MVHDKQVARSLTQGSERAFSRMALLLAFA
jgi:hypothetical protein